MLVNGMTFERWKGESYIWEHGTSFGIKAMHLQMLLCDADKARFWGRERDIFEYLVV
jgi:hypothetical protein